MPQPHPYSLRVGRTLARLRREQGLSQTKVAEAAGLRQAAWSKIERGLTSATVAQLAQVAPLLKHTPNNILWIVDWSVE